MALTATFAGDFDRFEKSIRDAAVKLLDFDRASKTSLTSMQREVDKLSGTRVVAEATRMTEAIAKLGGGTNTAAGLMKLLPDELARVSAALDTAAKKSALLGMELPPALQKIQKEIAALPKATDPAKSGMDSLAGAFKQFGPLIGITSFAAVGTALVRLGTSALDSAGQIADLADKTGLSTDAIQEMQEVANETGTSVDTFTQASFKLGVNVAEGGKKARDAIKDLGLEYDHLRALAPEQQFRETVRALEQVADVQERNRLGVALYGKQYAEMASAINQGYSQIADGAAKAGEAQIRSLDKLGDAWTRLKGKMDAIKITALGSLAEGIEGVTRGLSDLNNVPVWEKLKLLGVLIASGKSPGQILGALAATPEHEFIGPPAPKAETVKAVTDYAAALAEVTAKLAALKPDQVVQLNAAIALGGESAKAYAEQIGIGAEGLDIFKDHAAKAKTEAAALSKAMAESIVWGDGIDAAAHAMDRLDAEVRAVDLTHVKGIKEIFEFGPDIWLDEFQGMLDVRADALRRWQGEHTKDITKIFEFSGDPGIAAFQTYLNKMAKSFTGTLAAAFKDLPQVLMRALEGGGDIGKSIGAMFGSSIFAADSDLTKSISGLFGKLGPKIGGALSAMLPGIGTALGALAGGLMDKVFSKFGEGKRVNDLRDAFTNAAGGIDKLAEHAAAAGMTLDKFYQAKTVKEYEAAIRDLDKAFGTLEKNRASAGSIFDAILKAGATGIPRAFRPAIEQLIQLGLLTDEQIDKLRELGDASAINVGQMTEDIGLFQGRLESLGPAFQQANIDKTAGEYVNAIDRLFRAGADIGGVLFDAREEISKLVTDSVKFGTTLPENMRPWIEELSRAGLLVEDNGDLIKDLSKIKFGAPLETEADKTQRAFEDITKAIQDLIETLKRLPTSLNIGVNYTGPTGSGAGAGGGGTGGGGGEAPTQTLGAGTLASLTTSAASRTTFHVPIELDGRTLADVVIDQVGNRLSVRGAR